MSDFFFDKCQHYKRYKCGCGLSDESSVIEYKSAVDDIASCIFSKMNVVDEDNEQVSSKQNVWMVTSPSRILLPHSLSCKHVWDDTSTAEW